MMGHKVLEVESVHMENFAVQIFDIDVLLGKVARATLTPSVDRFSIIVLGA